EFVPMIAVEDDLAFRSARHFEIVEEGIARVVVPLAAIAISVANVVSAIARVILFSVRARAAPQFDPGHLDVSDVVVAITWIEVIEHRLTSETSLHEALSATDEAIMESQGCSNFRSEDVGS